MRPPFLCIIYVSTIPVHHLRVHHSCASFTRPPFLCIIYASTIPVHHLRVHHSCASFTRPSFLCNIHTRLCPQFGEEHPKEVGELWAELCSCWPNNLRVIIRYLLIVVGMAPAHLLPHAQRVAVSLGITRPDRLVEELMVEMGCVETLCLIERTETPPFFRVTAIRKCSGGEDEGGGGVCGGGKGGEGGSGGTVSEAGTLHTKRHSGDHHDIAAAACREQRSAPGSLRSVSSLGSGVSSVIAVDSMVTPLGSGIPTVISSSAVPQRCSRPTSSLAPNSAATSNNMDDSANEDAGEDNFTLMRRAQLQQQLDSHHLPRLHSHLYPLHPTLHDGGDDGAPHYEPPQPHPLPMPEYGGYFAPLTEYLPHSSQPITAFHRCYLSVLLMCEVLVAGIDVDCHSVDWSIHVPLMLHISVLGLDHSRPIVHEHCKRLLVHLLTVLGDHGDHLGIARVLLNTKTTALDYKLVPNTAFHRTVDYTGDPPATYTTPGGDDPPKRAVGSSCTAEPPSAPPARHESCDGGTSSGRVVQTMTSSSSATAMCASSQRTGESTSLDSEMSDEEEVGDSGGAPPLQTPQVDDLQSSIKGIVDFIAAHEGQPLWSYEDITPKQLIIRSAQQLACFVRHVVAVLSESLPHSHLEERLAQIALHLALSCSSRHYAGRSLQVCCLASTPPHCGPPGVLSCIHT
ncbi:Cell morphogenesis central region, partial [Trinorchestia longiramus]